MKILNIVQLIKSNSGENETPNWREVYFTLRQFIWQRLVKEGKETEAVFSDEVVRFLVATKGWKYCGSFKSILFFALSAEKVSNSFNSFNFRDQNSLHCVDTSSH